MNFSFSGLKTSVLYAAKGPPVQARKGRTPTAPEVPLLDDQRRCDIAASFQRAAITAIIKNLRKAITAVQPQTILVGGGVSANSALRSALVEEARAHDLDLRLPSPDFCLDNAAMIAATGAIRHAAGERDDWTLAPAATSRKSDSEL